MGVAGGARERPRHSTRRQTGAWFMKTGVTGAATSSTSGIRASTRCAMPHASTAAASAVSARRAHRSSVASLTQPSAQRMST